MKPAERQSCALRKDHARTRAVCHTSTVVSGG
jgi:hypothetical protein